VVLPEDQAVAGPDTPPPLPAATRPDPMPVVEVAPGQARSAPTTHPAAAGPASPPGGPVAGPDPARAGRLLRLGVAALAGGLLIGLALRRLLG